MQKIFKLAHKCHWGPLEEDYFFSEESARRAFHRAIQREKKEENYDDEVGMDIKEGPSEHYPNRIVIAVFQTWTEVNNENGHESYEEHEELEISTVEVEP